MGCSPGGADFIGGGGGGEGGIFDVNYQVLGGFL